MIITMTHHEDDDDDDDDDAESGQEDHDHDDAFGCGFFLSMTILDGVCACE